MTFQDTASVLRAHLESLVLSPVKPVVWPNKEFDPDTDGGLGGWIYAEIGIDDERQTTFGATANVRRESGRMTVLVTVPRGELPGGAETIAGLVRDHFKAAALSASDIHITSKVVGTGRHPTRESRWYAVPVQIDFFADRLESQI